MVARPTLRPVVLVGDGAFQMTGMELSTIVQHGFNPVVIVLDNQGYGTERQLHAGDHKFNDIQPWHYHRLPEILGGGRGYEIRTEGDFDSALRSALADTRPNESPARPSRRERSQPDARTSGGEAAHARVNVPSPAGRGLA